MLRADQLEPIWYGDAAPGMVLRALSAVYGALNALRRDFYRRGWLKSERLPVPVIVIGNLSVGGTGKTPLTIALVETLRARGLRPGVISRGYGGSVHGVMRVTSASTPALVGDEPCLIHARTGVPLAVGRDRVAAGRELLESGDVDVILADDGLQHYRLCHDVEICVIDGVRRFGNRRLLPAGPLREPLERLGRVDVVICNGGEAKDGEVPMRLLMTEAVSLDGATRRPLLDFASQRVHAVAGIGNPARFFDSLRQQGIEPIPHAFPDHHRFAADDLSFADVLPVLMTEKDAVKCRDFRGGDRWYVPVTAELPEAAVAAIIDRVGERR